MAILVAAGGAALGSAIGIGANTGWLVGSVIGNLLFPSGSDTTTEGSRLSDLSVSSSAYGAVRTVGFGTIRQSGNVIWSSGIREQKNTSVTSIGKGSSSSTTTITYTYFCSFAQAFGEGVAEDVLRIWADGNIIYDKTGTTTNTKMDGLSFRFYGGDEDQLPDSLMQDEEGEENTPAYRGTCYIMFDDLPLEDFGNRIPSITAEIAYKTTALGACTKSTTFSGGATWRDDDNMAVDWDRQLAYIISNTENTLRRVNLATMVEDRQVTGEEAFDDDTGETAFSDKILIAMPDGGLILQGFPGGSINNEPVIRLDPNTLRQTALYGYQSALGGWPETVPLSYFYAPIQMEGLEGEVTFLCTGNIYGTICGLLTYPDLHYLWDSDTLEVSWVGRIRAMSPGRRGYGYGSCFFLNKATSDATKVYIHEITVLSYAAEELIIGTSNAATVEKVAELTLADLGVSESYFNSAGDLMYDETDDTVIFGFSDTGTYDERYAKIDPETGEVIWVTEAVEAASFTKFRGMSRIKDDTFGYLVGNARGVQINTQTGNIIQNGSYLWDIQHDGTGLYDSRTESFIGPTDSSENSLFGRWFFNRGVGDGENLGNIIEGVCERVGLEATDIDMGDLSDVTVPGYAIGRQVTARSAIETLSDMYLFDGVESDFVIKFRMRGEQDVAATITEDKLACVDEDEREVLPETRTQESELPQTLTITYMDKDSNYVQSTHSAKRTILPQPSMWSYDTQSLSLALAISPDTAKQQVEKALYSAWAERVSYDFKLSWEYLVLDPTDVIDINLDSGASFRTRITEFDVGVGFSIEGGSVAEESAQYISTATAYAGDGVATQTIRAETIIETVLLDSPLLRDIDEPASRAYNPIYVFMGSYQEDAFATGSLYKSTDGTAYEYQKSLTSGMAWGATAEALGDPPFDNPCATDTENTLTIYMQDGGDKLESVTKLAMLNGANGAAIIKSNGEVEVIQFQNVTENSNGSFTLDTLLRGRRGTDTMSYDHTAGELFVLLIPADSEMEALTLAELNAVRYYRGVGTGQYIEEAAKQTLISNHRALMPYAPVHVRAVANSSDIDISWVRRTRVGGGLKDGTGTVPLSEDTEAYEIDIYDGAGGDVIRTVTGIVEEAYTYLEADIVTDFGSMPSELTLCVYQISAQVGRGFTYEVTTNVE